MRSARTFGPGRIVLLAGGLLLAAAPAAPQDKADLAAAGRGRTTYERYCKVCHGDRGAGDGVLAKDLVTAPGDLTRLTDPEDGSFPYEKVVEAIDLSRRVRGHGSRDMPAWGKAFENTDGTGAASPAQAIKELAHYIWSIQKKTPKQ